jgi:ribosome-associated protein
MNSKPSKSARKREYSALQELGEQLIALSDEQLGSIELDERLREAVVAARSIKSHGALRRQRQYIGKLMRQANPEPIREALDRFGGGQRVEKAVFRQSETWRDRIVGGDDSDVAAFFEHIGNRDDALQAEIRALRAAASDKARKEASRRLFREIHRLLALKGQIEAP